MVFLFLCLVTEADLLKKLNDIEEEARIKYNMLYSIEKELASIKTQDQKLRNRLSYISNEKFLSYSAPNQHTRKLQSSDVLNSRSFISFNSKHCIEFYNENRDYIKSINIDFSKAADFPNEFDLSIYIGKETVQFPKQVKKKVNNIVLQTPIQATKISLFFSKKKDAEKENLIPSLSVSYFSS